MLIVSMRAVEEEEEEEEEEEMRDLTHHLSVLQANDTTHTHTPGGGYPTLPPNRTDLLDEENSTSGSNMLYSK